MFKQEKCVKNEKDRKRGRPIGKNRIPLSLEERRARNAQYERERRNETAEAMQQLAQEAGCEPTTPNADILATVISQIQHAAARGQTESLDHIKRCNDNLRAQILKLQNDLRGMPEVDLSEFHELMVSDSDEEVNYEPRKKKIKREPESWSREYSCFRKKNAKIVPKIEKRSPTYEDESDSIAPEENYFIKHESAPTVAETTETCSQVDETFIINSGTTSAVEAGMSYPPPEAKVVLKPENSTPVAINTAYLQPEELIIKPETIVTTEDLPEQGLLIRPDQSTWVETPEVEILEEPSPAIEEWWGYETESNWTPPDPFIGAPVLLAGGFQTSDSSPLLSESPSQTSESESLVSSPLDLDFVLGTLTDEEKMLLSGAVQQIDHSTVLGL